MTDNKKPRLFRPTRESFKPKALLKEFVKIYVFYMFLSMLILMGLKDKLVLFPMKNTEWRNYIADVDKNLPTKTREVKFKADNGKMLDGFYIKNNNPTAKLVLVCHGNAGSVADRIPLAAHLAAAGASALVFDYEGYGDSEGESKMSRLIPDAVSAFDYAKNELGYKAEDIILYGESIGCGVATGTMQKRTPKAIILQSPFVSLMQTARDKLFFLYTLPDIVIVEPQLNNMAAVIKEHPPLLLMHGEDDKTLPCRYSKELYEKALEPKQLVIIPKVDHNDMYVGTNQLVLKTLRDFIAGLR